MLYSQNLGYSAESQARKKMIYTVTEPITEHSIHVFTLEVSLAQLPALNCNFRKINFLLTENVFIQQVVTKCLLSAGQHGVHLQFQDTGYWPVSLSAKR